MNSSHSPVAPHCPGGGGPGGIPGAPVTPPAPDHIRGRSDYYDVELVTSTTSAISQRLCQGAGRSSVFSYLFYFSQKKKENGRREKDGRTQSTTEFALHFEQILELTTYLHRLNSKEIEKQS